MYVDDLTNIFPPKIAKMQSISEIQELNIPGPFKLSEINHIILFFVWPTKWKVFFCNKNLFNNIIEVKFSAQGK